MNTHLHTAKRRTSPVAAILGLGLLFLPVCLQAQSYAPYITDPFGMSGLGDQVQTALADLDNDGDLDLVTGTSYGGWGSMTLYYENAGTRYAPSFGTPVQDAFGGEYIGVFRCPEFVDIDADGDLDFFSGSQNGDIRYFENTGSASEPVFALSVNFPFGLYHVGYLSTPTFADVDNDGDQDALVAEFYGGMHYFQNTGTTSAPSFSSALSLPFGLSDVGDAPKPEFIDLDVDGDEDLLVGVQNGNYVYFQNTGTASAPAFAAPVTNPFGFSQMPDIYAAATFGDLDYDGDADMLASDNTTVFKYFQNTAPVQVPSVPTITSQPGSLTACYGTSATVTAAGYQYGILGWYDAPTGGNFLGHGTAFVTPELTAGTTFYVQDSTSGGVSPSRAAVTVAVTQPISEQTVYVGGGGTYCGSTSNAQVYMLGSQTDVTYALRNSLNDTVMSGPTTGTGSWMYFNSGPLSTSTELYVLAESVTFVAGGDPVVCQLEMPLTVTIHQPATATATHTLCYGEAFTYADGTQATGIVANESHVSHLTTTMGCDSTLTENLVVQQQLTATVTTTICAEEELVINGTTYNAANPTGTEVFTASTGCDSTVTIALNVLPALTATVTTTICAEEELVINGTIYNSANPTGTEVFTASTGCDSTVTIALNVLPVLTSTVTTAICAEEELVINGTTYNAANPTGTEIFTASTGCDSTVTIALNVLPVLTGTYAATICPDGEVVLNGTVYNAANPTGTEVFTSAEGCDSTVTVTLTVSELNTLVGFTAMEPWVLLAAQENADYQWIDCGTNQPIAGATGPVFTATENGSYALIVTKDGCTDTSTCITIGMIGLGEHNVSLLRLYPNPAGPVVTISGLETLTGIQAVQVVDVNGKSVIVPDPATATLDVSSLVPGVYHVQVVHDAGIETLRLVKQ